jgi:hypothetical protein
MLPQEDEQALSSLLDEMEEFAKLHDRLVAIACRVSEGDPANLGNKHLSIDLRTIRSCVEKESISTISWLKGLKT